MGLPGPGFRHLPARSLDVRIRVPVSPCPAPHLPDRLPVSLRPVRTRPRPARPCSVTHRRSDAAPQPGAGTPTGGSPPEPGADQPSLTPGGHLHDEEVAVRVLGKLGDR